MSTENPATILLTAEQLQHVINIGAGTIRKLTKEGRLPHVLVGRQVRYLVDDVLAALRRGEAATVRQERAS